MGRQSHSLSSIATSLGLFLAIFLLLRCAQSENRLYPTANQNLSPNEAWRSTEFCLQNISSSCPVNYTLTHSGWLNVTHTDGPTFCEAGGCAEHTRAVLLCLYHVKIDYYFANFATIKDLSDTINNGCTSPQGFTGVSKYSSDGFRLNSAPIFTALSAIALLFISIF
ncbi:hypothetical protein ABFS83_14G063800 [Erythranthe nasuta]